MKSQFVLIHGLFAAVVLTSPADAQQAAAQSQVAVQPQPTPQTTPVPPPKPEPAPLTGEVYVRRFSAGGFFTVQTFASIPSATTDQTVSTNVTVNSKTEADKRLFGGGIALQVALTNRFAVAADLVIRRSSFKATDITYQGVDDTTTTADERTKSTKETQTRADLTDIPILLRYYTKDRTRPGRRRFYEGGVAFRNVHSIHSFGQTTANDGTVNCCDETPLTPANKLLTGFVAGVGWQFIDDMKIRIIPEVRYTRWMGRTFDTLSTRSRVDQLEACVSITF